MSPTHSAPRRLATTVMVLTAAALATLSARHAVPGAARIVLVQEIAPAVPPAASGVVAAAPFSLRGIAGGDRARALQCLTAAIYYEAATEGDAGQAAVAQVVLNRVRHPAFPATVCGVVYQGAGHPGCQFSFACDGAAARAPVGPAWARAARTAALALNGRVFAPVGWATYYHTYAVTPAWNRSLVMTDAVGAHFFHRWKGAQGTAAAFRQRYRGGETMPLPLPPVEPAPALARAAIPIPLPPVTITEVDHLPPASEVLDRWKDAGKPIDR